MWRLNICRCVEDQIRSYKEVQIHRDATIILSKERQNKHYLKQKKTTEKNRSSYQMGCVGSICLQSNRSQEYHIWHSAGRSLVDRINQRKPIPRSQSILQIWNRLLLDLLLGVILSSIIGHFSELCILIF